MEKTLKLNTGKAYIGTKRKLDFFVSYLVLKCVQTKYKYKKKENNGYLYSEWELFAHIGLAKSPILRSNIVGGESNTITAEDLK